MPDLKSNVRGVPPPDRSHEIHVNPWLLGASILGVMILIRHRLPHDANRPALPVSILVTALAGSLLVGWAVHRFAKSGPRAR